MKLLFFALQKIQGQNGQIWDALEETLSSCQRFEDFKIFNQTKERRIYETYFVLERVCHTVFIKTRRLLEIDRKLKTKSKTGLPKIAVFISI